MHVKTPDQNRTADSSFAPLVWRKTHLEILDQRRLPQEMVWLEAGNPAAVAAAIRDMAVRGAPAIGIAAAWGVVLAAREHDPAREPEAFEYALQGLEAARPTAVNLRWAVARMRSVLKGHENEADAVLSAEAKRIQREDLEMNRSMAALGAARILPGSRVYTHCNTGALATGGIGTALGVIVQAHTEGKLSRVFATETRPWMQGARLTAWELSRNGIAATLITEGAAAFHMQREGIDWLIVGADRIAANGDTANKIGTYALAVLAKEHGGRVMVVAPSSTVDMALNSGKDVPIEDRPAEEILKAAGMSEPPPGITVGNPAFDVTPAAFIDLIVTDKGVVEKPSIERMRKVLGRSS